MNYKILTKMIEVLLTKSEEALNEAKSCDISSPAYIINMTAVTVLNAETAALIEARDLLR